ncbi:FadR/GntR family transcriptional regulator [Entomospira entomophila]|uniref:FadR family transcriptional regulator n=1 Tax=Entomospira entomophila TaxID=2719988 RepID=A0A968KW51_9SPIO|nr:FadR/GntR family transcriptional regulator [Entomospira entomophilus]NIZ40485.1 FadR family transcriptional regulator [Entomospira entomophilus]WDI36043.1 FadR/GntR family transcriptional regulator [Entomospira entomophilus]
MQEQISLKTLLPQLTVDRIQHYIQEHQLQPGDQIPSESQMTDMFSVSRSTVREAVKILHTRGVLTIRRGVGTFITTGCNLFLAQLQQDRKKLLLDIAYFRLIIEPELMPLVVQCITQSEIEELFSLCDRMETRIALQQDYYDEDVAFHTLLMRASGNHVMIQLIPIIEQAIALFMEATDYSLRQETIATHRAVAIAIVRGDVSGAKDAIRQHLQYNVDKFIYK